jgi:hypothetical protein
LSEVVRAAVVRSYIRSARMRNFHVSCDVLGDVMRRLRFFAFTMFVAGAFACASVPADASVVRPLRPIAARSDFFPISDGSRYVVWGVRGAAHFPFSTQRLDARARSPLTPPALCLVSRLVERPRAGTSWSAAPIPAQ